MLGGDDKAFQAEYVKRTRKKTPTPIDELPLLVDIRPNQPAGIEFTNAVRGELMTQLGYEVKPDDPIMIGVKVNQIILQQVAEKVAGLILRANVEVAEKLGEMRHETLGFAARDLECLYNEKRTALNLDLAMAEQKAYAIVNGIGNSLRFHRGAWVMLGLLAAAIFIAGYWVGKGGV